MSVFQHRMSTLLCLTETQPRHSHETRDMMRHGYSRHEPRQDVQVSRLSRDRDMKNHVSTNSWRRYGIKKLRHCHPMFCSWYALCSFRHLDINTTHTHTRTGTIANSAHHATTSAFSTNSLHRRRWKPTVHCNKSRDPVDLPEKLRQELQHLAT